MCLGSIGVIDSVWIQDGVPLALVDYGATTETVCLMASPAAQPGARVLVHLGFVVEVLDADEAADALRLRKGGIMGEAPA